MKKPMQTKVMVLLSLMLSLGTAVAQDKEALSVGKKLVWQPKEAYIDRGPSTTQGQGSSGLILEGGVLVPASSANLKSTQAAAAANTVTESSTSEAATGDAADAFVAASVSIDTTTVPANIDRVAPLKELFENLIRVDAGCYRSVATVGILGEEICVEAFSIMNAEVSNAQYRVYRKDHDSGSYANQSLNEPNQPVVGVSIADAQKFASWLSRSSGREVRLPTPIEWEYAAQGGVSASMYWGEDPSVSCVYANVADASIASLKRSWDVHPCSDQYPVSAPVRSFRPNAFGLYDVIGNVWEWVDDKLTEASVSRGGSWSSSENSANNAYRYVENQYLTRPTIGFRLVVQ